MRKDHFKELIDRYLNDSASPAERALLEEYYARLARQGQEDLDEKDRIALAALMEGPQAGQEKGRVRSLPFLYRNRKSLVAAAVLLVFSVGVYLWTGLPGNRKLARTKGPATPSLQNDITPGGNKALLTLSNGTVIVLDTVGTGVVSRQGGVKAVKLDEGHLAYNMDNAGIDAITYNTLSTPRGGQYKVTLADGSNVWLNAASSLRYPTGFRGGERIVEITGEAYFEVAKNPSMPFVVKVNGAEVRVLGTAFNVMAYDDEAEVKTTLLQGSVVVSKGAVSRMLKPGQQARLGAGGTISLDEDPDTDEVLAWKNNLFAFNDADIESLMRQIGRWYDVDVQFEGKISKHFNGNISRAVNVSKVFKMLELTGSVHFRIEDKKIVVSP